MLDGINIGPYSPPHSIPGVATVPCQGPNKLKRKTGSMISIIFRAEKLKTHKKHKHHILGDGWNKYWSLFPSTPPIPIPGVAKVPCQGANKTKMFNDVL